MRPENSDSAARTELREMVVRLVHSSEQPRYQELMREHHYLGHLPKIGETLWYLASWREQWVALLSFSASALKCAARDRWIGWSFRQHYARLKLVVNLTSLARMILRSSTAPLKRSMSTLPDTRANSVVLRVLPKGQFRQADGSRGSGAAW